MDTSIFLNFDLHSRVDLIRRWAVLCVDYHTLKGPGPLPDAAIPKDWTLGPVVDSDSTELRQGLRWLFRDDDVELLPVACGPVDPPIIDVVSRVWNNHGFLLALGRSRQSLDAFASFDAELPIISSDSWDLLCERLTARLVLVVQDVVSAKMNE